MSAPKFPHVKVKLTGRDGNAYAILGATRRALKDAGVAQKDIDEYYNKATDGDYDHLIQVTMKTVDVS